CDSAYKAWEQAVLLPYADATARAPECAAELRESFDRVCRRTAAAGKDDSYFARANKDLDTAVSTRSAASRRASFTRLIDNALENGWDGLTAAHRQAVAGHTTVVNGTQLAAVFGA